MKFMICCWFFNSWVCSVIVARPKHKPLIRSCLPSMHSVWISWWN